MLATMTLSGSWAFVASVMALIGTVWQARSALLEMREQDLEVTRTAVAVRDLWDGVKWWHPIRRLKQRRLVKDLLADSPVAKSAYDRVNRALVSWSVLATAALMASIGSLFDLG